MCLLFSFDITHFAGPYLTPEERVIRDREIELSLRWHICHKNEEVFTSFFEAVKAYVEEVVGWLYGVDMEL